MKWKDSDDDTAARGENKDIDFDGDKFSLKSDSESQELRPNLFKKNLTPILMIGAGAVVLVILLLLLFSSPQKMVQSGQVKTLEAKIRQLEDRVANLEKRSEKLAATADQSKAVATLKEQLGRLETTLAGQMNMMANDLEDFKKQLPARLPEKMPVAEKPQVSSEGGQAQYHQVQPGENLYRIGLQYGLRVDQLLRLNNMEPGAVLRPGQKLRVSP